MTDQPSQDDYEISILAIFDYALFLKCKPAFADVV
jgi:hypothetical protein